MHNGLKFRGADGVERAVSPDHPLPTTAGLAAGAATETTLADVASRLGATNDAQANADTGTFSINSMLKRLSALLGAISAKLPSSLGPQAHTSSLSVVPAQSGTATVSSVAGSASSVILRGATTARKSLTITNDSTATLYVLFGTGTASASNYSVMLLPYERLFIGPGEYQGAVNGVWSSAAGSAKVSEVT